VYDKMEQKLAEMRDEGMTIDGIEAEYDLSELPTGYIRCVGPCRNKNAPMLSHTGTGSEVKLKLFNGSKILLILNIKIL